MTEPQAVTVKDADGNIGTVAPQDLDAALEAGAQQITPEQVSKEKAEREYGGASGAVAAGIINAADAVTLGYGKGLAAELGGDDTREYLKGLDEAHPFAAGLGTAGGVLLPALLSGGSSALAEGGEGAGVLARAGRAALVPQDLVSGLGDLAEHGAQTLLGDGAIGRVGGMAARGAAEGAAYGSGQAFTDAEIENHDLTAEQLMAGVSKGALWGSLLSGGGELATMGIGAGARALAERAGGLEGKAGEIAYRATGAKTQEIRKLAAAGVEPETVGRFMLDELPEYSDKPFWKMDKEDIQTAAKAAAKDAGEQISLAIDDLEKAAQAKGAAPSPQAFLQRMDQEVIDPLRKLPGYEGQVRKLEQYAQSFADKSSEGAFSFGDFKRFRQALDDQIFRGNKILSEAPIQEELRKTRSILEDEIEKQGGDVAGADWLERYKGQKRRYQMAKSVDTGVKKGLAREQANREVSLTDTIAGAAGFAHMGPLGLGAALVHKVAREHGDQIMADVLNRASTLSSVKQVAAKTNQQLDTAVSRFLGRGRQTAELEAAQQTVPDRRKQIESRRDAIRQLAADPSLLARAVQHTAPPSSVAPNLAAKYGQKQAAALQYLASVAPAGRAKSPLMPTVTVPPTKDELRSLERALDVYEDPIGTISKHMGKGTLSSEHVKALKAMYPSLFQDLQTKVMQQLTEKGGKLPPYAKRLQLGMLLDIPADATLEPAFIASQQQIYSQANTEASESAGSPPPAPRNVRGARESLSSGEDSLDEAG